MSFLAEQQKSRMLLGNRPARWLISSTHVNRFDPVAFNEIALKQRPEATEIARLLDAKTSPLRSIQGSPAPLLESKRLASVDYR